MRTSGKINGTHLVTQVGQFPETLVSSIHVYIHQIFLELTLVKKGEEVDEYGEANAVNE